ncbi:PA0069 family radical SAM protein [Lysobacter sp. N42]|uniref:PA0069 family radical SAM protein n=1 Tax=Lysobacter sp. N42 TaxID=2545719 RepID=UPI0010435DBA|nr:PA0069 family radical SAM protein [Lysobacter sp. N42]TCZ85692.1 PA0069 family radical SAM protein [Lysobacter sp. N42]
MTDARKPTSPIKGRGAASRVASRFDATTVEGVDDGWGSVYEDLAEAPKPATTVTEERARRILTTNQSPDLGFSQSLNPYRGCEHGCVYCFARPTHAYLDLSPGLDFETRLFAKTNAVERLREELARPGYVPQVTALGINTDAYQPIERRYRITREVLELFAGTKHPVSFVTKSALIERDVDLLAAMARENLVSVHFSVTSLDNRLSARLEPRAAAPHARLRAMRVLADAGVPVGVMVAPVIPMITDMELERILEAAFDAGAREAGYTLLRLPHELKEVFREWLQLHYPDRAAHVMSLVQQMRGGKDYQAGFGTRMTGTGVFAQLLAQRFRKARARIGYGRFAPLDASRFVAPRKASAQGELF